MSARTQTDERQATTPPELAMLAAMREAELAPAEGAALVADGDMRRYRVEGDKPGSKNGWYVLHGDRNPVGVFGSWRTGAKHTWHADGWESLSETEKAEQRARIATAKAQAAADRANRHAMAAKRAASLWAGSVPADAAHPYAARKRIEPMGARQQGGRLVLPIRRLSDWSLASLQFIDEQGGKRMLSGGAKRGHAIPVHAPEQPDRLTVCEGWATGCTLAAMSPGDLVLAAIDAGNLEPVALAARERWPDLPLVVACDNDRKDPDHNPGMAAGRAAAINAGGRVIWPDFPPGAPLELSDFNDLMAYHHGGAE
ncbi:toprim domain-containing protein [Guyparkeria halophila]|nr:toprim domain-containing protein [Guyparkeria halophila]